MSTASERWEAMQPRDRDAWVAEHVMGWEREPQEWHPGANVVWFRPDEAYCREHREQNQSTLLATAMTFTTDAAADYLVLERVRETWDEDRRIRFNDWLEVMMTGLSDYRIGQYSQAAFLTMENDK